LGDGKSSADAVEYEKSAGLVAQAERLEAAESRKIAE